MSEQKRPASMLDRRLSQGPLLPDRPASAAGWESSDSINTIYLEDSMETLVSPRLPQAQAFPISLPHQGQGDRPYSTAVGWNSSATLRNSASLELETSRTKWKSSSWAEMDWQDEDPTEREGVAFKEGDARAIRIRYGLMLFHTILFVIKIAHTVYLRDSLLLILIILSLLAFLIYIPTAFGLSLARKGSHFDHAGGEVAYLAVQAVLWMFSDYWALVMLCGTDCGETWDWFEHGVYAGTSTNEMFCTNQGVSGGISLLHTLLLAGWLGWIVWIVVKRGQAEPGQGGVRRCFQVSTHWLLRGRPITGGVSGPPY